MKCLILLLAMCVLYPAAKGMTNLSGPKTIMKSKCSQTGDNNTFVELNEAFESFGQIVTGLMPRHGSYPSTEDFQLLCTAETKPILKEAFLRVVDKVKPCWTKQEQYMNKFLLQMFNDVMEQVCQTDDPSTLVEIISFTYMCYPGLKDFDEKCLSNLTLVKNLTAGKYYWGKNELCKDVKLLQRCVTTVKPCKFIFKEGIRIVTQSPARWCNAN